MTDKNIVIKEQLIKMSDIFKAEALILILSYHQKDFNNLYSCHLRLINFYEKIISFIKESCSDEIAEMVENDEISDLPECCEPVKIVNFYRNKISNLYMSRLSIYNDINYKLMLNKMAYEIYSDCETPLLNIAGILNSKKKFAETIKLYSLLDKYSNMVPTLKLMGYAYEKLGRYDIAIDCYSRVSHLDEHNSGGLNKITDICKKVLK